MTGEVDDETHTDGNEERVIKYRGIKTMPFVIGNETFEKLGTVGISSNLIVYLTTEFHMKSITATNIVNVFNGSSNFATLIGAFLADTYFGRYNIVSFASVSSFLGMVVLALTAAIPALHPAAGPCSIDCKKPTISQVGFLLFGLGLLVIGAGGIRPCNLTFGADQFNPKTEPGKRGLSSYFNWYYFTSTIAVMISMTFIVYVQSNVSWSIGLAIPAGLMLLSCLLFFMGTKLYVKVRPEGSPLVSVVQVIVASFRKRHLKISQLYGDNSIISQAGLLHDYIPSGSLNAKLPLTDQFRLLNKASIITEPDKINPDGSSANPWRLCTIQQVEDAKCIARILPIWISEIIYYISQVTLQNYVVLQALQSDRHLSRRTHFQIPAASYNIFVMLALTIWIPIYERALVPLLRALTGKESGINILQKIGVGMVLSVISMFVSAQVEYKRRELALTDHVVSLSEKGTATSSSISGLWLLPPLVLAGVSEAFAVVGLVEFYYKEMPDNMRSIGGSLLFSGMAISSYLSSFLGSLVNKVTSHNGGSNARNWLSADLNRGRLDYFYCLIAGLELINVVYFLACAKWYRYRGN